MQLVINTDTDSPAIIHQVIAMLYRLYPPGERVPTPATSLPTHTDALVHGQQWTPEQQAAMRAQNQPPAALNTIPAADNPETGATVAPESYSVEVGRDPMMQRVQPPPAAQVFAGTATPPPAAAATFIHGQGFVPAAGAPIPPPAAVPPAATDASGASSPKPSDALDAAGMPWDGRIHSSTKARNADGKWRAKRGLPEDGALVAQVEAELRGAMGAPPPAASVAPPLPPAAPGVGTFPELCQYVTAGMTAGWLTDAVRDAALAAVGVPTMAGMAARPDLVPAMRTELGRSAPQGVVS